MTRVPVGVLASGSGTNFQALLDASAQPDCPYRIAVLLTNRPRAGAIERAEKAGIPAVVLRHKGFATREAYDAAMVAVLRDHFVEWVALAGFMRLVTPVFLDAFPWHVLNIHPALLPSFPGVHAQAQTFEYGTTVAGVTVHLVDSGTDTGPIIGQAVVPVLQNDTVDTLAARILEMEHRLFPLALGWAVEDRLTIEGRKVRVDLRPDESRSLFWTG